MIERIRLVAGRELGATLLTRAFVMMVLAPVIAALIIPMILLPITLLASREESRVQATPAATPVEIVDASGRLGPALDQTLGPAWTAQPADGAIGLLDSPGTYRLVFPDDAVATGRYTLEVQGRVDQIQSHHHAPLVTAADEALARLRTADAGLAPEAVQIAFAVHHELAVIEPKEFDFAATWARVHGYAMPAGVLFLMFAALSMAGQGLLTSTLEEKSTRVAEVLLGAVSPVELLTGKVLGQLGVSLILSLLWGGPTLVVLALTASFALGPLQVLYLLAFIGIASLSWAAVMGGIGSAVNDLTEAQHILAPLFMVMMLFFIPALMVIAEPTDPNLVAMSMLPPTAAPVMAARVVSLEPAPHWQVWVALASSTAFAVFLLWAAGRLFRIGLLLRSSPPNLRTLIRWVLTG